MAALACVLPAAIAAGPLRASPATALAAAGAASTAGDHLVDIDGARSVEGFDHETAAAAAAACEGVGPPPWPPTAISSFEPAAR